VEVGLHFSQVVPALMFVGAFAPHEVHFTTSPKAIILASVALLGLGGFACGFSCGLDLATRVTIHNRVDELAIAHLFRSR
jgi:hypothetical protein